MADEAYMDWERLDFPEFKGWTIAPLELMPLKIHLILVMNLNINTANYNVGLLSLESTPYSTTDKQMIALMLDHGLYKVLVTPW